MLCCDLLTTAQEKQEKEDLDDDGVGSDVTPGGPGPTNPDSLESTGATAGQLAGACVCMHVCLYMHVYMCACVTKFTVKMYVHCAHCLPTWFQLSGVENRTTPPANKRGLTMNKPRDTRQSGTLERGVVAEKPPGACLFLSILLQCFALLWWCG